MISTEEYIVEDSINTPKAPWSNVDSKLFKAWTPDWDHGRDGCRNVALKWDVELQFLIYKKKTTFNLQHSKCAVYIVLDFLKRKTDQVCRIPVN